MDPKDRVETLVESKISHMRGRLTGDAAGAAPGAGFSVDPVEVDAIIDAWPEAPKKVARETVQRYGTDVPRVL